jgi:hypothetical protein
MRRRLARLWSDPADQGEFTRSIGRAFLAFAGAMILVNLPLNQVHHLGWLWLSAFVATNLLNSAVAGFCPMAIFRKRIGLPPGAAFG